MENKKILIISVTTLIVMVCLIFGVLYFTTDLFKTNQQLFYKYIAETKVMNSTIVEQYGIGNNKKDKDTNSSKMAINLSVSTPDEETGIADVQEILNVSSNGLEDALSNQSYRDFTFSSNKQNFLTVKYLRDENTHAIIADNILAKYLAVENANLKDFFKKLGVEDTSLIPDSIQMNYEELFKIDDTTLETLKESYSMLLYNSINKSNFYKIKNADQTETIGISLTEQELYDLVKTVLKTVKNDSMLLDLVTSKMNLLGYTDVTTENVKEKIQDCIDKIDNYTYSTQKDFLKLGLVKKDAKILRVELELNYQKNEMVDEDVNDEKNIIDNGKYILTFDFSEQDNIKVSLKQNDIEISELLISYDYNENNIIFNVKLENKYDDKNSSINAQYQLSNYQTDNINESCIVTASLEDGTSYQLNISKNTTLEEEVQISRLTNENSALLNDMKAKKLKELKVALENRIISLYGLENKLGD